MKRHRKRRTTGKQHSNFEDIMRRGRAGRHSRKSFKNRAGKTAKLNRANPRRGGTRL